MGRISKPRAGSMAFYPKVKAKSIIPKFNSFGNLKNIETCKPVCYYAFKTGMTHLQAKNAQKGTSSYGQEISIPVSVIETPELKVIGARLYKSNSSFYSKKAICEFIIKENILYKTIKGKKQKKQVTLEDFLKRKNEADDLVLLCYINTKSTNIGQKKPVVVEIPLSGSYDKKINYLKEKISKTISVEEVFEVNDYLDAKSITKGKGTQGPVKRFGIKIQRPKTQQIQRHVGSIGPWHPATIMFTVPRAGQLGFYNRTTFNKKILIIDSDPKKINKKSGFKNYGIVKNKYIVVKGTVPGPAKRIVVLRKAIRPVKNKTEIVDISYISK